MVNNWTITQKIDLSDGVNGVKVWPNALMLEGDKLAHTWSVEILENGRPAEISGNVRAYFIRADGATVMIEGSAEGNVVSVTLTEECYAFEGDLKGIMQISDSDSTVTISALLFRVRSGYTTDIVDPGQIVPSLDDLLAELEDLRNATIDANSATNKANTAADNADAATSKANDAAASATSEAEKASAAAEAANNAEASANEAAQAANEAAKGAQDAIDNANAAADTANQAATDAETATQAANTAASTATSAASEATTQAAAAEQAASDANAAIDDAQSAAQAATDATQKALDAADRANQAASGLGLQKEVLDHVPEPSEMVENVIYLVPAEEPNPENVYNEYMLIDGQRELIGSTATNLTDYVKSDELNSTLENYAEKSDLETKADLIEGKVDPAQLPDFASKTELANKSDKVQIIEFSIPAIGWDSVGDELYSVVIENESIRAKDAHIADLKQSGDEVEDKPAREAWAKITRITASDGSITVYASESLESAINIELATWADAVNREDTIESEVFIVRRGIVGSGRTAIPIENAVVTLDTDNWTFDGSEHCPVVTSVTLKGQPLTENKDFVCLYVPARDAGSYKVQVLGVLDYGGVVEAPWSIAKAEGSVNLSSNTITVKGIMGTADSTITVTKPEYCKVVAESQNPEFATAEIIDGSKVKITSVKAGIAHVIVKVSDDNFTEAEATLTVTVQKADGSISVAPSALTLKGEAGTSGTATLTVTGDGAISFSMQPDGIVTVERADKILTVKSVTEGHTVVTISLSETEDYTGSSCTLTVDTQFRLPVSDTFQDNTWEAIFDAAAAGEAKLHWHSGDVKTFNVTGTDEGEYEAQIIGFDHDDLDPTDPHYNDPSYNGGTNKAAITLQFRKSLKNRYAMHSSNDNSVSWEKCTMRTTKMPELLSSIDPELAAVLRIVTKKAPQAQKNATLVSTADKLFLLGPYEVFASLSYAVAKEGEQYEYYKSGNSTVKELLGGSASNWWLRCPASGGAGYFCRVTSHGSSGSYDATYTSGVAAGFCI